VPLRHGVRAVSDGYRVSLGRDERELLDLLAAELVQLVTADDDAVARLFPAAYRDDPAAEEEYRRLTRSSLVDGRVSMLETLRETSSAERLTQQEADAWLGALNDLRLVLGERLGVTEDLYANGIDPHDPRAPELSVYGWLTWLQAELVEALASRL
jgi:Domain of unknown function (DUF2017)